MNISLNKSIMLDNKDNEGNEDNERMDDEISDDTCDKICKWLEQREKGSIIPMSFNKEDVLDLSIEDAYDNEYYLAIKELISDNGLFVRYINPINKYNYFYEKYYTLHNTITGYIRSSFNYFCFVTFDNVNFINNYNNPTLRTQMYKKYFSFQMYKNDYFEVFDHIVRIEFLSWKRKTIRLNSEFKIIVDDSPSIVSYLLQCKKYREEERNEIKYFDDGSFFVTIPFGDPRLNTPSDNDQDLVL